MEYSRQKMSPSVNPCGMAVSLPTSKFLYNWIYDIPDTEYFIIMHTGLNHPRCLYKKVKFC
jgi:hypothetical protein